MRALILVDIQNDFLPGGALAVPHGHEVVPVANKIQGWFDLVVATQDWHPENHGSFAANHAGHEPGEVIQLNGLDQVLWPVHCTQGTCGAEFAEALETTCWDRVFRKGTDPSVDSYSGFFDNGHRGDTGLGDFLNRRNVDEIYLVGLATDYCVKFTALDGRRLGFDVFLVADGCRGVNLRPGDVDRAIEEMKDAGVKVIESDTIKA